MKEKPSTSSDNSNTVNDIPIFTEEFLNFNKGWFCFIFIYLYNIIIIIIYS